MKTIDEYKLLQESLYDHETKILETQTLCKSLSGLIVPLITITNFSDSNFENKKMIFIQGRVHPGETNSSWVIHGLIRALLMNNHLARTLRSLFIFQIIPMINPDGVVFGNYRTSFLGKDMNR